MSSQTAVKIVRAQNIPKSMSEETFRIFLTQSLAPAERESLTIQVSLVPSCCGPDGTNIAIVKFSPSIPRFLSDLASDHVGSKEYPKQLDNHRIVFDKNFYGLTQLYNTRPGSDIVADIVAVTGLNGRAFDSWRGSESFGQMWLKDFFNEDLPSFRTMIYGYNTKWESKGISTVSDLSEELLIELQKSRSSEDEQTRPLIFLGHSFGAIVITQALISCTAVDATTDLRSTFDSTQAVLFFGAPHRGMDAVDILDMANELAAYHRIPLVQLLSENPVESLAESFENEIKQFANLSKHFAFFSFYETQMSQRLLKGQGEKPYARKGDYFEYVKKNSALLGLPRNQERRIPVDSNHSNMVKFNHKSDRTYQTVLFFLREVEIEIMRSETLNIENSLQDLARLYQQLESKVKPLKTESDDSGSINFEASCWKAQQFIERLQRLQLSTSLSSAEPETLKIGHDILGMYEKRLLLLGLSFRSLLSGNDLNESGLSSFLAFCSSQIQRVNQDAASIIKVSNRDIYSNSDAEQTWEDQLETLTNMARSRSRDDGKPRTLSWIDADDSIRFFEETREYGRGLSLDDLWNRFAKLFDSKAYHQNLKYCFRRYGVLKTPTQVEEIMAEFRPYPSDLCKESDPEYHRRRIQIESLGRMLVNSQSTSPAPFPTLRLRGLSEISDGEQKSFLLVYSAHNIRSLGQIITECCSQQLVPPKHMRQKLALNLSKAVASFHLSKQVHGLLNTENVFFQLQTGTEFDLEGGSGSPNWECITKPLLAGFEVARDYTGQTDRIDVEDPDLRVYLHPERLQQGDAKAKQHPFYDIFSLGMVLTEIGLWKRFKNLKKYQDANTDEERQRFATRLRRNFRKPDKTAAYVDMGLDYDAIVKYCVTGDKTGDSTPRQDIGDAFLGSPNGLRVVSMLENLLAHNDT